VIELIVGSAMLLAGLYLVWWWLSPRMRDRIERPKHAFLQQAREFDGEAGRRP
jgi:hypothetical protein